MKKIVLFAIAMQFCVMTYAQMSVTHTEAVSVAQKWHKTSKKMPPPSSLPSKTTKLCGEVVSPY